MPLHDFDNFVNGIVRTRGNIKRSTGDICRPDHEQNTPRGIFDISPIGLLLAAFGQTYILSTQPGKNARIKTRVRTGGIGRTI